ncbi:MAG: hypothetical protein DI527_13780 [Chelatococcus sp.]|nr:MAG: hypothetical protein DI527_13780 [Chelatococcus sp.]
MIRILTASAVLVLTAGPLLAQERGALRDACSQDAATLCSGVKPGGGRILACFKEKSAQLSEGCRTALSQARTAR